MGWYDLFAPFYDGSVEKLYTAQRFAATEALALSPGMTVLDLPCGTGQSLDLIAPALGPEGHVFGVDFSGGMLKQAAKRAARLGLQNVSFTEGDARSITLADLGAGAPAEGVDRLHIFLGLTAFPDWRAAFAHLWGLLKPGGRCVIVDVHSAAPDFQGKMVNLVARADITRPTWEALEAVAEGYARIPLPSEAAHGGALFLAYGDKGAG